MGLIETIENIGHIFIGSGLVLTSIALIEEYFIMNKMKKKQKFDCFKWNRDLISVPDELKTQEMCNRAVEKYPWDLRYVPDHLKTKDMCDMYFNEYKSLKPIPEQFITLEMCKKAVSLNVNQFEYVLEKYSKDQDLLKLVTCEVCGAGYDEKTKKCNECGKVVCYDDSHGCVRCSIDCDIVYCSNCCTECTVIMCNGC